LDITYLKGSHFRIIALVILWGLKANDASGQNGYYYNVQSNIIYRFTKYVDWPQNKKSGDFVIGIVGETPFYDEMKRFMLNKVAGSQKIVIKRFPSDGEDFNCAILFISESESHHLKHIAALTSGDPVLLVTESNGLVRKGACVNFIIIDDHLKLEFNTTAITEHKLNIAPELLSLGTIFK
jgi:hypothetical protein